MHDILSTDACPRIDVLKTGLISSISGLALQEPALFKHVPSAIILREIKHCLKFLYVSFLNDLSWNNEVGRDLYLEKRDFPDRPRTGSSCNEENTSIL